MSELPPTARHAGLLNCHRCGLLNRPPPGRGSGHCRRCHGSLHWRKPNSLARTWAYLLAAAILYIPANLLPVMKVVRFGRGEPDTILSGIHALMEGGMWMLALIVFVASILVPLLKIGILTTLLLSVGRGACWYPKDRTTIYRLIEGVGHWSMVDIYAIAVLISLVRLEAIATIEIQAGATYFGAVVILTMLASKSFDPRLIWDAMEKKRG